MMVMGALVLWPGVANALPDPIAWWTFNDGSNQTTEQIHGLISTLSSNNGTTGPGFVAESILPDVDCNRSALSFDGVDDYVSVPDPGGPVAYDGLAQLSLSAWVRAEGDTGGVVVSKYDTHNAWLSWFLSLNTGRQVRFAIGGAGGHDRTNEVYQGVDGPTIPAGQWVHLTGVWTGGVGAASFHLFIDGVEVQTTFLTNQTFTGMYQGSVPIEIGAIHSATGSFVGRSSFFRGLIDDVRVYDAALSSDDVAILATGGGSIDACDQCPIVCLPEPSERVFYGVVRRGSDGSLGSVQCWTAGDAIECRRDVSGELLVGEPMCGD